MPGSNYRTSRVELEAQQSTCCAVDCDATSVIASRTIPLCESHLIQSYRETTQYLKTQTKVDVLQGVPDFKLIGDPFGYCPSCDYLLLARDESGRVKCINDNGCSYTATPREFHQLCDVRIREMTEHSESVYYIRFGDRVKIGTTKNLSKRLKAIPHDEVMATEPGGLYVEQQRHKQFAHLQISTGSHREWFTLTPELLAHINAVSARQDATAAS
jgi:hypothetical protein